MNINEWPKEAKEVFIKLLNEQGFHKVASMINLDEDLQFKQLVEMAKDERTVKDELIKEVMSAVTEEHLKLFDEYSKMKAEEEAARHETIMINREIAKHQLDKVNEEAVMQTEQSEPEQKVEPQQPSVIINESELKQFFKYDLRRKGFYEILIERLNEAANKLHFTDMDYARIAYLLFKSPHFLKPKSNYKFTEWYKAFCNIVGCKYHDTFYPSTLKRDQDALEKMFNSFYFLDVPIEKVK